MDQPDQELLDKQFRYFRPRHDGTTILMLIGVFFVGMMFGGIWLWHQNEQTRIASNDAIAATTLGE
jgi:hypothetical protein